MYVIYTNSIEDVIFDQHRACKIYADGTKFVGRMNDAADHHRSQAAIFDFYRWTVSLDLRQSVEKCLVIHYGSKNQRMIDA